MKTRIRHALLPLAALALILLATGCEDEEAQRRAEAARVVEQASHDLVLALLSQPEPGQEAFEKTRRKLNEIATALGQVRGAGDGPEAAAALLGTTVHRALAEMRLTEIAASEADRRRRRAVIGGAMDQALHLDAIASAHGRLGSETQRKTLSDARAAADGDLQKYSNQVAALDKPISELEGQNADDRAKAMELNRKANDLRRQASEQGHAEGLALYEQAIALEGQADEIEGRIANRENDLQHELRPEHNLAARQVAYVHTLLDEVAAADAAITSQDQLRQTESQRTEALVTDFRTTIDGALRAIDEEGSALAELYEQALAEAAKARQDAGVAVSKSQRGKDGDAHVALARAHELEARILATRAHGLEAQHALVARRVEAKDALGDAGAIAATQGAIETAAGEAQEKARDALTAAREELGRTQGAKDEVAAFRRGLDRALAALAGEEYTEPKAEQTGGPAEAAPATGATGAGLKSPEAVLALLKSLDPTKPESMNALLDAVSTPTPGSVAFVKIQREGIEPLRRFASAMAARFGEDATGALSGGAAAMFPAMSGFGNARITERSERTATIECDSSVPGMPPQTIALVLDDAGGWMIDGRTLTGQEIDPSMIPGMEATAKAGYAMLESLADRIDAGEFATPQDLLKAMQSEAMKLMPPAPPAQ